MKVQPLSDTERRRFQNYCEQMSTMFYNQAKNIREHLPPTPIHFAMADQASTEALMWKAVATALSKTEEFET